MSTGEGILGYNMFAYCSNNPVQKKDVLGTTSVDIFDEDGNPLTDDDRRIDGGKASNGNYDGTWEAFRSSLQAAMNGLKMASGRDTSIVQRHHLISNKHSSKTDEYKEIIKEYGYSLNDESNLVYLPGHRGRHTNAYHDFIYIAVTHLKSIAAGDLNVFKEGMVELGNFILEYPWIPYAKYK